MAVSAPATPTRRSLRFGSYDEALGYAHRANEGRYVALGNWSLGKALAHLGQAMQASIDGVPFPTTLRTRVLGRLVFRYVVLYWRFPPGIRLPRKTAEVLVPENEVSYDEGLARFRAGVDRLAATSQRQAHPVLGKMTVEQWNRFHLRHAELHLSFFAPLPQTDSFPAPS